MNSHSEKRSLKARRREAVVEALVEAAEAVFARKGYEGATMQDIARQADCAAGTLYLYFKNKEDLFNAMIAKHSRAILEALGDAFGSAKDPVETWRRTTRVFLAYFNKNQAFFRVFYSVGPGGQLDFATHPQREARRTYLVIKDMDMKVCRAAQKAGAIRTDIKADELVEMMHGVTTSTLARWSLQKKPPAPERQFKLLWGFISGGLGVK